MGEIGPDKIVQTIIFFFPFLFALCFHEYAHGWVAKKKGDNTAEMMGRLTLNPMAHIDWLGTVAIPIMALLFGTPLFGWAKPVPVNSRNLSKPRSDMFWIALAGPGSNILLFILAIGFAGFLARQTIFQPSDTLVEMLKIFLLLNLYLAVFNMLPLHPLDGGKILARFLPARWNIWLENYQYESGMILLLLVILGVLSILSYPVHWIMVKSIMLVGAGHLWL